MPRSKSERRDSTRSSIRTAHTEDKLGHSGTTVLKTMRVATVYDAVAGKVGLNGFLTQEQLNSTRMLPSPPQDVLLRRVNAPDQIAFDFYNADERLREDQVLPGSDLLKAVHSYVSDFYAVTTAHEGAKDHRTFDGSALLALGILLEEASVEVLGENGDMALVEPEGMENEMLTSSMAEHQVIGRVKPRKVQQRPGTQSSESDDGEDLKSPRKRKRTI